MDNEDKWLFNANFKKFISARFLFTLSLQIQFVSITWYIYLLTKDPMALGFVGLCEALPAIGLSLLAGQWVDRNEKKSILLVFIFLFFLASIGALYIVYLHYHNQLSAQWCVWLLYVVVFLNGVKRSFVAPTISAYWPTLVPSINYPKAAATNSSFWQLAAIIGPLFASFLIAKFSIVFAMFSVVFFLFFAIILMFRLPKAPPQVVAIHETITSRIVEGLHFVYFNKIMLGAMCLDLFSVFFAGVEALIPFFADQILNCGPTGFGWLRAAPSIGSICMLSYLSMYPSHNKTGKKLLICVALFGVSIFVFGLSKSFFLSFFMLLLSGVFDGFSVVVRGTINQLLTPDHMRGRVSAVSSMFISSSNELGAMESGFAAKCLGTVTSVLVGSCVTFCFVIGIASSNSKLRNFEIKDVVKHSKK
jgi:MFS family permease